MKHTMILFKKSKEREEENQMEKKKRNSRREDIKRLVKRKINSECEIKRVKRQERKNILNGCTEKRKKIRQNH